MCQRAMPMQLPMNLPLLVDLANSEPVEIAVAE
jgi:hypothetical protein